MNTALLFQMGQLAEASYANLWDTENNSPITNPDAVRAQLENRDPDTDIYRNFSPRQATDFVANWSVLHHQPNTTSGFSATLFRSTTDANTYIYAIRGTEPEWLVNSADLGTDVGDIVLDGAALKQIVDMYNDVLRMRTDVNQVYQAAVLLPLTDETLLLRLERTLFVNPAIKGPYERSLMARNDVIIDNIGGNVYTIGFQDSTSVFTDTRARGDGTLLGTPQLTVTGHSLGGHLAVAFNRLFSEYNSDAYQINGAGFPTGAVAGLSGNGQSNIRNLFGMLGGDATFDASRIQNVYGSAGIKINVGWAKPNGYLH